jgi:hypothetical protein
MAIITSKPTVKKGSTFLADGVIVLNQATNLTTITLSMRNASGLTTIALTFAAGNALMDLTNATLTSSVEAINKIVYPLAVVITNPTTPAFTLSGDTEQWMVGDAKWDLRFDTGTATFYTPTIEMKVVKNITAF